MHNDMFILQHSIEPPSMVDPSRTCHYNGVIMSTVASQITSLTIVYSTVYSRCRSKKTSKLHVTGLCEENSPVTGEFPAQGPVMRKKIPSYVIILYWRSRCIFHTVWWGVVVCEWATTSVYFEISYGCFIPRILPVFAIRPHYPHRFHYLCQKYHLKDTNIILKISILV